MENNTYNWTDNPTVSGISQCDTDILNECLMYLRYNIKSGRNIGDIFYTMRKNTGSLNGAYDCKGIELSEADFEEGNENPYTLLVNNILPWVNYEDYENQIIANNGNCAVFALDTINHKFKTPTLKDVYIAANDTSKVGEYITAGIPNITGGARMISNGDSGIYGAFKRQTATGLHGAQANLDNAGVLTIDASRSSDVYGASDTVRPKTVCYRPMVQLANIINDKISVETYTNRIEAKTNEGINALSNASNSLTQSNITNCILSIPKHLNIEYSDNILTIKAGSIVTIPNGFEEDSITPKFNYKEITADITTDCSNISESSIFAITNNNSILTFTEQQNCSSSDTTPENSSVVKFWYDKQNNKIKSFTTDAQDYTQISFPICKISCSKSNKPEIDYIFDGAGYIGSLVWLDKDIKCLIPTDPNNDGSLNNIEYTTSTCSTIVVENSDTYIAIDKLGKLSVSENWEILEKSHCFITHLEITNGLIETWTPLQTLELLKQSDKREITGFSFPSSKYVNLSVASSGSTYTVPADGWLFFSINGNANYSYATCTTSSMSYMLQCQSNYNSCTIIPIKENEPFTISWGNSAKVSALKFIYAHGAK